MGQLPYMHEWRAISPNNLVLLRYERARLFAAQVNTGADFSDMITDIDKAIEKQEVESLDRVAATASALLSRDHFRLRLNASLNNDVDRRDQYHAPFLAWFTWR